MIDFKKQNKTKKTLTAIECKPHRNFLVKSSYHLLRYSQKKTEIPHKHYEFGDLKCLILFDAIKSSPPLGFKEEKKKNSSRIKKKVVKENKKVVWEKIEMKLQSYRIIGQRCYITSMNKKKTSWVVFRKKFIRIKREENVRRRHKATTKNQAIHSVKVSKNISWNFW